MRQLTRQIAFDPHGWGPDQRAQAQTLFDSLATGWPTVTDVGPDPAVADALDRGLAHAPETTYDTIIDLGGGNGRASQATRDRFGRIVIVDLSVEMLLRVPRDYAMAVQADASQLPFPRGGVDVVVLANMFLFPQEIARVVADRGVVVWVNSWAEHTPIHLTAQEVDAALPGNWSGVASRAGEGTWSVHWRDPSASSVR